MLRIEVDNSAKAKAEPPPRCAIFVDDLPSHRLGLSTFASIGVAVRRTLLLRTDWMHCTCFVYIVRPGIEADRADQTRAGERAHRGRKPKCPRRTTTQNKWRSQQHFNSAHRWLDESRNEIAPAREGAGCKRASFNRSSEYSTGIPLRQPLVDRPEHLGTRAIRVAISNRAVETRTGTGRSRRATTSGDHYWRRVPIHARDITAVRWCRLRRLTPGSEWEGARRYRRAASQSLPTWQART